MPSTRREFLHQSFLSGSTMLITSKITDERLKSPSVILEHNYAVSKKLDLSPARWIWLPAQRTLPNTVLIFKKTFSLLRQPSKVTGWILGESRYKLYANGKRIQFGPAPSDPRWSEVDPFDITEHVKQGMNVVGAEVLFYGLGDGTWPIGKPGFIFKMEILYSDGIKEEVVSDESWQVRVAKSWPPGQYKRWYLRAFQEEFDARLYSDGWKHVDSEMPGWLSPAILIGDSSKPALAGSARDYLYDSSAASASELRARSIPLCREPRVFADKLTEQYTLSWKVPPEDYFQFVLPVAECFTAVREKPTPFLNRRIEVNVPTGKAIVLTFELDQQHVGFPFFSIIAPENTVIEMLVHEAHEPGTDVIINSHFNSWTRFICKAGTNHFETFDFECFRWMQLHIRNANGQVIISDVGIRRRIYDWKNKPVLDVNDKALQKLIDASINTIYNCCVETVVDGMARERQQYSGDVGHLVHALLYGLGETAIVERYLNTFSQGITNEGYFLDCWPAFDRLARLPERQMGMTPWGPLLDHGVGFNFDCYYYYSYTGSTKGLEEIFPRLVRFFNYIIELKGSDGLLPVENIGVPVVWIDHDAYKHQRHKQCAFNLYFVAMLKFAFAPLCDAFNEVKLKSTALRVSESILNATVRKFWSREQGTFVNNLPWLRSEGEARLCDRSLSTAVLFKLVPQGIPSMTKILIERPSNLGISYPANACWHYWALASQGYTEVVINEFKNVWYKMPSVQLNNTLGETWNVTPDSNSQWSHCPVVPFYFMYMNVAGVKPIKPGYDDVEIRPALKGLTALKIRYHTRLGEIIMDLNETNELLKGTITIPTGMSATLILNGQNRKLKEGANTISG